MNVNHTVESALRVFWHHRRKSFVPMTARELEAVGIPSPMRESLASRKFIAMTRYGRANVKCYWSVTDHGAELFASGRAELSDPALPEFGWWNKQRQAEKRAVFLAALSPAPSSNADLIAALGAKRCAVSNGLKDLCANGLALRVTLLSGAGSIVKITKAGREWLAQHEAGK